DGEGGVGDGSRSQRSRAAVIRAGDTRDSTDVRAGAAGCPRRLPLVQLRGLMTTRFPFRFDPTYRRLARLFGVTPERAWVELSEGELEARYGPWRVRTRRSNIADAGVTGPYAFLKTAGP